MNYKVFFEKLLGASSSDAIRTALESIGDSGNVGLDQKLGSTELFWTPFGESTSNESAIGLGTEPGRSLTERITNAIDAVLESRAVQAGGSELPTSPAEAAQKWFSRPQTGPNSGLYSWKAPAEMDRKVRVVLSGQGAAPLIDVFDSGIGLSPTQLPTTILSLQRGNKIKKRYLAGAFGQGGSATLGFCDYALVISRAESNPKTVSFTLIRVMNLDASFKNDCWGYLALRTADGTLTVPSFEHDAVELEIHAGTGKSSQSLAAGTCVRHIGYRLGGLDKSLAPSPGNLYHFLHLSMFDPLLPFRVIDLRNAGKERDERVNGSRNRLMKLVAKAAQSEGDEEGNVEVIHHRPMEYIVPLGSTDPSIGLEYWVIQAKRVNKGELKLRSHSSELFANPAHPIIGTMNGQNQGELSAQIIRDVDLGLLSRHMVVHLDASRIDQHTRRALFASNREGLKKGPLFDQLVMELQKTLRADGQLYVLEKELTDKLVKHDMAKTNDEVRKQIAKLLMEQGITVKEPGPSDESDGPGNEPTKRPGGKRPPPTPSVPLPTLPFPGVTKFKIVFPTDLKVAVGDSEPIMIETDADAEFDKKELIKIRAEPKFVEMASKTPLRGGRMRFRLRPVASAKGGEKGKLIATLTKPDGSQLTAEIDFLVEAQPEAGTKPKTSAVPPFDVQPVDPTQDIWSTVWPELDPDEVEPEKLATVAYKPVAHNGRTVVYYSTVFAPYDEQVSKLKSKSASLAPIFEQNYAVWIGYHAILQEARAKEKSGDPEDMGTLLEEERARVGRMQAKQAAKVAELIAEQMKKSGEA